jgi:hypothetical protein
VKKKPFWWTIKNVSNDKKALEPLARRLILL